MPPELAFISPLVSAIVGAAIAYFVMRGNQQHQAALDDTRDSRTLRDAKRTRLASIYASGLTALVTMDHFLSVQRVGGSSATDETLEAVFPDIDRALAQLMLEPDAHAIAQQFEELLRAFTGLRIMQAQHMDPQVRLTDVQRRRDAFQQKKAAFQQAIHASLDPLDQPVSIVQRRQDREHGA